MFELVKPHRRYATDQLKRDGICLTKRRIRTRFAHSEFDKLRRAASESDVHDAFF